MLCVSLACLDWARGVWAVSVFAETSSSSSFAVSGCLFGKKKRGEKKSKKNRVFLWIFLVGLEGCGRYPNSAVGHPAVHSRPAAAYCKLIMFNTQWKVLLKCSE
jgi:hypothetical protein